MSLNEIAFLLGYSEQSPFQNAFRRWTGESLGSFQEEGGEDAELSGWVVTTLLSHICYKSEPVN